MIPKIIHLCWFSNDPFPVEIKVCLDTWKRILPDFQVKHWTYQDAKAIGCRFINEALEAKNGLLPPMPYVFMLYTMKGGSIWIVISLS